MRKLPVRCNRCSKQWSVPARDWPYDWNRVDCACGGFAYVYGTPAELKRFVAERDTYSGHAETFCGQGIGAGCSGGFWKSVFDV